MNYNVRIDDNFLRGDHVDGEVLQHTDLNELENVAKTAINANYEDIQKLQDGTLSVENSEKLDGATLSKFSEETLQNSDTKVPTSSQVKQYVDGAISGIDLDGYYTKRETDEILEDYPTFTDYAGIDVAGVVKLHSENLGTNITPSGYLSGVSKNYTQYQEDLYDTGFISKGTLENVISGKDLIDKGYVDAGLDEKVDKVSGKQLSTEDYTTSEKSKLSNIEAGAQVNKIETIKINGTSQEISSKSVNIPVPTKTSDLTNDSEYVKNTDYASDSKGGVFKTASNYGTIISSGVLVASNKNYTLYQSANNNMFIGKGTLENVITGKGLVSNTNYATSVTGGVIKTAPATYATNMDSGGYLQAQTRTYAEYTSGSNAMFISKATLENVLTARIGDISSAIDLIQGEVI